MNENVNGNRKLFWKEVSSAKGGKVESCTRIKDGNGGLAQEEDESLKIWKDYFEDLYNIDTQEQIAVPIWALMAFGEVNTSEESQLQELRLR